MHSLGIAGARAAVMGLDSRDAIERHFLECGGTIKTRHFGGLVPAGRSGWVDSHRQRLSGTANKEVRALRSDWSGVPEASIIWQSTALIAKVSCCKTRHFVSHRPFCHFLMVWNRRSSNACQSAIDAT
jgi:hypothetical protein